MTVTEGENTFTLSIAYTVVFASCKKLEKKTLKPLTSVKKLASHVNSSKAAISSESRCCIHDDWFDSFPLVFIHNRIDQYLSALVFLRIVLELLQGSLFLKFA